MRMKHTFFRPHRLIPDVACGKEVHFIVSRLSRYAPAREIDKSAVIYAPPSPATRRCCPRAHACRASSAPCRASARGALTHAMRRYMRVAYAPSAAAERIRPRLINDTPRNASALLLIRRHAPLHRRILRHCHRQPLLIFAGCLSITVGFSLSLPLCCSRRCRFSDAATTYARNIEMPSFDATLMLLIFQDS